MNMKNAGILCKLEAVTRLMAGEIFHYRGVKILLSPCSEGSPFRIGECPLAMSWDFFKEWQVECQWYKDITKPVLCWVDDSDPQRKSHARLITSYIPDSSSLPFRHFTAVGWTYATPVTKEDLL